jgi:sugar-specific transcriptional regulator TrmB
MRNRAVDALRDLGLNQLEAEVYLFLLGSAPVTAYAVAKAIGKATANVYKAVESLSRIGAVLIEEGENRLCHAVSYEALLERMDRDMRARTLAARDALEGLENRHYDERIYRIEDAGEVFDRCERMLASATSVVAIDAFPTSLDRISPIVEETAARGVDVRVQAYRPVKLHKVTLVIAATGEESVRHWAAEQLNVVVDGRESLLALLDSDLERVHQALWSRSLYLSCLIHAGRMAEHTLHRVLETFEAEPPSTRLRRVLKSHSFFIEGKVPGQLELFERFGRKGDPE